MSPGIPGLGLTSHDAMTIIMVRMAGKRAFELRYDPQVKRHLQRIEAKYHSLIRKAIEEQLSFDPEVETLNRKPLMRPVGFEADWELRLGPGNRFRVFYAIDPEQREVWILAIGVKDRSRLTIGGEEVRL